MLRRSSWTCLHLILASALVSGCGSEKPEATASLSSTDRLKGAAQTLANDPTASPTARKIANAALERSQENADLDSFAKGQ